uniref:C2H2-type domain-containing protein n=1 Tax=Strigamia maritima TaxID=126957 RepID=T1IRZ3_STRMM
MSRRKQSNPKPIKLDEEEEDDEELEEEVERNHSSLEGEESGDVVDDEELENSNVKASSPKIKSCTQGNSLLTSFECPVCMKELETQHDFTVHIRMHNSEEHTTTHTCSLCAKTLSSASSLDRHMLVHSGERPFKCSRCNMAFTTNGNMHRHMRTHHGESSSSANRNMEDEPRVRTPTKRPAASPRPDDESAVPAKKISVVEDDESITNGEGGSGQIETTGGEVEEQLHCPVCNKGFLCKYGLQTHLETHPDYVFKCHECNLTFRNYRGLNRHQYVAHVKRNGVKKDSVVDQALNTTLVGFQDLTFLDFSSAKFAMVAKAFCEKNARRPSSAFHIFECPQCKKAFPCGSALKMHLKSHSNHLVNHHQCEGVECLQVPFADKENFLAVLGLQANTTTTKDERRAEEPYENPNYFTHGMPCNKNRSWGSCSNLTSDGEDFADIQSILSLTTCPALLSNMNGNVNSVSASSSSPRRGLAVNPESPATADSATASPKMPSDVTEQAATSTSHSMNSVHPGRFPCKLCPLVFPNLRALKGHNRSHLGMSPYRCNMCSYTSIDKSTLLRHLRTHNGERPFMCRLCQYAFTTKANCERHMRKRHGKHNKQEICSAMEQKPQLHDPENTLNSFHCPDTVCKYCNVDFKFYRILRHHLRSLHSSCARKPFQCRQCHMGFSTKNNCYRHVQKQHDEVKDNVEENIWCCYSDTVMAPGKEGRDDEDGDAEDERSGNENDGMQSPALSMSPGPPLLDPMIPIADTSLSDMEMSSVEALVSWSTRSLAEVPLQEEPLDLAVHPVDLTLKKSSGLNKDISPPCLPKINQPTIHIPTPSSSSYSHLPPPPGIRVQSSPFICRSVCNSFSYQNPLSAPELSPGSTISSSPSSLCSIDTNRPSKSTCSSPVAANLTKQGSLSAGALVKKQKQKRYRTERPFKCDHCDAGFTLRSNMERHIKQQHPDQFGIF